LPRPAKKPPAGPGWIHEIKHDGFRILAERDAGGVTLHSRNGYDFADRIPLAAAAVAKQPVRSCMIDDEAIVCDANGLAVFELLRRRWQCIPCPTRLRAAGRQERGRRVLSDEAMGGGKIHSLIAFGLPAADRALRSVSRVSYALRGRGRDLKMRAFTLIQKEAA
jgi:ATP dependent DNA ligase domain